MHELLIKVGEALLVGLEGAIQNAQSDAKKEDKTLSEYLGEDVVADMWKEVTEISEMFDQIPESNKHFAQPIIERFELVIEALESN